MNIGELTCAKNAIGSALQGVSERERTHFFLSVLFAHTDPDAHPAWTRKWPEKLLDYAFSYNRSDPDFEKIKALEDAGDYSAKAIYDYTISLSHCYETSAKWIALIEDDVIFADGWHSQSLLRLLEIKERIKKGKASRDWLYMRLFNDERSSGWASSKIGANNEIWISLGIATVFGPLLILGRSRWQVLQRHLTDQVLAITFLLTVPAFVVLFYQAGKASVLPPSPGVFRQNFGCCSQGLIFPRRQIPDVIGFLRERGGGQIDLILKDLASENGLDRYSLYPVQLQHVGTYHHPESQ